MLSTLLGKMKANNSTHQHYRRYLCPRSVLASDSTAVFAYIRLGSWLIYLFHASQLNPNMQQSPFLMLRIQSVMKTWKVTVETFEFIILTFWMERTDNKHLHIYMRPFQTVRRDEENKPEWWGKEWLMEMDKASNLPSDRVAEEGHFEEMAYMGHIWWWEVC